MAIFPDTIISPIAPSREKFHEGIISKEITNLRINIGPDRLGWLREPMTAALSKVETVSGKIFYVGEAISKEMARFIKNPVADIENKLRDETLSEIRRKELAEKLEIAQTKESIYNKIWYSDLIARLDMGLGYRNSKTVNQPRTYGPGDTNIYYSSNGSGCDRVYYMKIGGVERSTKKYNPVYRYDFADPIYLKVAVCDNKTRETDVYNALSFNKNKKM